MGLDPEERMEVRRSLRDRGLWPIDGAPDLRRGRSPCEQGGKGDPVRGSLCPGISGRGHPGQKASLDGRRTPSSLLRQSGQGQISGRILFPRGLEPSQHYRKGGPQRGEGLERIHQN